MDCTKRNGTETAAEVVVEPEELGKITVGAVFFVPLLTASLKAAFSLFLRGEAVSVTVTWQAVLLFLFAYLALLFFSKAVLGFAFRHIGGAETRFFHDGKHLLPRCAADTPLSLRAYRWSVATPILLLAAPPYLLGLFTNRFPSIFLLGTVLLIHFAGDLALLWRLRKLPPDAVVRDLSPRQGCAVSLSSQ